jgi:hypothetical protein
MILPADEKNAAKCDSALIADSSISAAHKKEDDSSGRQEYASECFPR